MSKFFSILKKDLLHFLFPNEYMNSKVSNVSLKSFILGYLSPEFRAVLSYRIQNFLYRKGYTKLAIILYLGAKKKYSCDIHPHAVIGYGFRIAHMTDIVIGPEVIIGNNVTVFNGVTLGNRYVGQNCNEMPCIGDNVVVGTGSKVLGGICIGQNAKIGANAVVLKDVAENSTYVGFPN